MNGVDLSQFQFEYDLTWMSFFQDANGKTYARYGGREDDGPESHLTKASLLYTMQEVLKLHENKAVQPTSRFEPLGEKTVVPSDLPVMKQIFSKRKETCIHCHDVKVAGLRHQHDLGKLTKDMVFTYPPPSKLGIDVDPDMQNIVAKVHNGSSANAAGMKSGDKLVHSQGQRLLTFADFTRVLELAPPKGELPLTVERNGEAKDLTLALPDGWRRTDDPSWRASLHTVGPGAGFWGRAANAKERASLKLGDDDLALKVTFIWAPHAKQANIKIGDIVTDLDGEKKNKTMRQFHAFLQMHRHWGDSIKMKALRNGKPIEISMDLPKEPPFE